MSIDEAIKTVECFKGSNLTNSITTIEADIVGFDTSGMDRYCDEKRIDPLPIT